MQHDLVTLEIDNGKLETAEQNLALLYDKTAAHILEKKCQRGYNGSLLGYRLYCI